MFKILALTCFVAPCISVCAVPYMEWFSNMVFTGDLTSILVILKELTSLKEIHMSLVIKWSGGLLFNLYKVFYVHSVFDLKRKKTISTPLMMEKPVRSPMVPPMRLSWASVLIFLSLSMSSKVAVSK